MAEKYYNVSPYAYCGNNPVSRIDPTGMDWRTKNDEEYAKSLSQAMTNRINSEQKSFNNLNAKIAQNQEKGKDISKDQTNAARMQANIDNLKNGISELKAMGDTKDQTFTYNMIDGDIGGAMLKDGIVVMNIAGNGDLSNGVHESSHGFDIWKGGMPKTIEKFYSTEIKAYGRQFSFGGSSAIPASDWGSIKSLNDIITPWVTGIKSSDGEYMYGKQILGAKYNKAQIKALLKEYKK
jgi:hypothetical protein